MSDNTKLASVDDLLGSRIKTRYAELTLPISGHRVRIRSWTEKEMSRYQAILAGGGMGSYRRDRFEEATRRLIVECLVDAEGNLLLQAKDMEKIKDWDAADSSFLFEKCTEHVGLTRQDIEALAKNCEAIRVGDSPST